MAVVFVTSLKLAQGVRVSGPRSIQPIGSQRKHDGGAGSGQTNLLISRTLRGSARVALISPPGRPARTAAACRDDEEPREFALGESAKARVGEQKSPRQIHLHSFSLQAPPEHLWPSSEPRATVPSGQVYSPVASPKLRHPAFQQVLLPAQGQKTDSLSAR